MKIMISQPMMGKSNDELQKLRKEVVEKLTKEGHQVIDTIFDFGDKPSLYYLAKSLEAMSGCDGVFFMEGWTNARGCIIERRVAEMYGLWIKEE